MKRYILCTHLVTIYLASHLWLSLYTVYRPVSLTVSYPILRLLETKGLTLTVISLLLLVFCWGHFYLIIGHVGLLRHSEIRSIHNNTKDKGTWLSLLHCYSGECMVRIKQCVLGNCLRVWFVMSFYNGHRSPSVSNA